VALTFGNVKHPPFQDRLIPDANNSAWNNLGQKTVEGVVWHRMIGDLAGTDGYFRAHAPGLTEYGVGVYAEGYDARYSDVAALDGVLYRWNDPLGFAHGTKGEANYVSPNRSPWASGPVLNPYGDGLAFLQYHNNDANAVNRNQTAIEIAGDYGMPLSDAAKRTIIALTAYWADQAEVPWDSFPIIPARGYSFVTWHNEYCGLDYKKCPGDVVMNNTDEMIAGVVDILKVAQTSGVTYQPPHPWPAWNGLDSGDFKALRRTVKVKRGGGAECYTRASRDLPRSGPNIPVNTLVPVIYAIKADDGSRWYVHEAGHRMPMTHFVEQFTYNLWSTA
jgi:hypothetical protein